MYDGPAYSTSMIEASVGERRLQASRPPFAEVGLIVSFNSESLFSIWELLKIGDPSTVPNSNSRMAGVNPEPLNPFHLEP